MTDLTAFLPLFEKIDEIMLKEGSLTLAVDGGSASGKTTLGKLLEERYGCAVFHMDDFFLQPHQRTAERYAEIGGNIDRERFLEEVLIPLSQNKTVAYRRFDCSTFEILPPKNVSPKKLNVIEGAYSMHESFSKYYGLTVFLDIDKELQRERIKKRNGEQKAERFFSEWIPLEERYFEKTKIRSWCGLSIKIK